MSCFVNVAPSPEKIRDHEGRVFWATFHRWGGPIISLDKWENYQTEAWWEYQDEDRFKFCRLSLLCDHRLCLIAVIRPLWAVNWGLMLAVNEFCDRQVRLIKQREIKYRTSDNFAIAKLKNS